MSDQVIKPFTSAEKEHLIELVNSAQAAVAEQDKWVAFLRKQHDVPANSGWGVSFDGFTAPDEDAPPAPAAKSSRKKAKA